MKIGLVLLAVLTLWANDPLRTGKINKAKRKAKEAYNAGDYQEAIKQYKYLIDSLAVQEPELTLNLAHSYYLAKDTANAVTNYQSATASTEPMVSSIANQQLGIMSNQKGKPEDALNYFKNAIKADPQNQQARYNYEMLKKKLEQKRKEEEQKKKDQNKDKNDKKPEPSEFAKRLKAQADRLVEQKQYGQAYNLMADGLKKDQTVSAFQDYIDRIKVISEINK